MSYTKIEHFERGEYRDTHHDSALSVTDGVSDQPIVNPYFVKKRRRRLTTDEYVAGILDGNITILSQAITLIESNNPDNYAQAQEIIERCLPYAGKSVRIGITGVPGAGKSTWIEAVNSDIPWLGMTICPKLSINKVWVINDKNLTKYQVWVMLVAKRRMPCKLKI